MPSVMIKISFTLRSSLSWWGAAEGVDVMLVDCDLWWTDSWFYSSSIQPISSSSV